MRIKHRFVYRPEYSRITDFLNRHQIQYEFGNPFIIVELFEDNKNFKEFARLTKKHKVSRNPPLAVYSQEELDEAQWLSIRSTWRYGYPQPEDDMEYVYTTYDAANYCESCKYGLVQKESFVLKREPNWGTRNFLMINWVHDELFVSKKSESVLRSSDLTGFDIYNVLNKSREPLEGTRQIFVQNYLDAGMLPDSVKRELLCKKCGSKKIMRNVEICYDKKVFNDIRCDIVKSKECFGEIVCSRLIFITQKFYKVMTEAKLDRGLECKPVKLI